jgi:hypothetical protein
MPHRSDHTSWAAEAISRYQKHSRSPDDHAIADLICDLGHLADENGLDFLSEVRRAIGHWYVERNIDSDNIIGPDADVEIVVIPK